MTTNGEGNNFCVSFRTEKNARFNRMLKTIEHKYFKNYRPKEENLLTWAMKEQLRYLHSSDPDMWTPEALSDAFPISPDGVKVSYGSCNEAGKLRGSTVLYYFFHIMI